MARKSMSKAATILATALVILFCTWGIWNCTNSSQLPSEKNNASENAPPGHVQKSSTEPTTEPTAPTTLPTETPTEPKPISLTRAPEGYFADALFIGDSRTVGLWEYGSISDACYFATPGMSVYNIFSESVSRTTFENLITSRSFGKIYVMLGINELGYDFEQTVWEYTELIRWIRQRQPDAIIYVEANLHVSAERSDTDDIYNNDNLDAFNQRISALADGKQVFYLDINPQFDDGQGNLSEEYTVDDTHILGKYYRQWSEWIKENAAVF